MRKRIKTRVHSLEMYDAIYAMPSTNPLYKLLWRPVADIVYDQLTESIREHDYND